MKYFAIEALNRVGQYKPWDDSCDCKGLADECCHQRGAPVEGLFHKHVKVVWDIGDSSGMSLALPKPSRYIGDNSSSRLDVDLVERSVNRYSLDLALCLPESFFSHMEVLSDCVGTSIPPPDLLG